MAIQNAQYDAVMRIYSRRQIEDERSLTLRREEAWQAVPELRDLDARAAALSVRQARLMLEGKEQDTGNAGLAGLKEDLSRISLRRARLLAEHGFPPDQLEMRWQCPDCRDTGYIGGSKCHCFRRTVIDLFYTQSGLADVLKEENFDHFSLDFYSDQIRDPETGISARANMERILHHCLDFLRNFDQTGGSLLFYGDTGLGKTFLTHCIARELLETAHSVVYFPAYDLFEKLAGATFHNRGSEDGFRDLLDQCDLLIIDDLGTELTNAFTVSELFRLLNDRISQGQSTIISTNLPLDRFAETYSERIFSRITSAFRLFHLFGSDIRLQKKLGVLP